MVLLALFCFMKSLFAVLFFFTYSVSIACSSFLVSKNGRHVFGKNYDWVTGNGMMMINARGLIKGASDVSTERKLSWVSEFGSVTFNQFGKEFPNGGMNEKGLVIELMWLDGSTYPAPDRRPGLGVLQWIQYQLDCAASVQDVLRSDSSIRVSGHEGVPLHYLVADASGDAATVEFVSGKMVVHQGSNLPYPVLTNSTYQESLAQLGGGHSPDHSLSRFSRACSLLQQYALAGNEPPVPFASGVLDQVAQGDFTKWRIVYDLTDKKVFFSTLEFQPRRQVSLADLDFSCSAPPLLFDLASQLREPRFSPLTPSRNLGLIKKSVRESAGRIQVTQKSILEAAGQFKSAVCK